MSVFKNGRFFHYEFKLDGRRYRGSTGKTNKPDAIREERQQRERLEKSYGQIIEEEAREQQRKTVQEAAEEFLLDYKLKHESATFAEYALRHVTDHCGREVGRGDHTNGRKALSGGSAGGKGRPENH